MARDRAGVRRRGEVVTDTKPSEILESDTQAGDTAGMARWFPRLFYPYRVLLLFSLVVCILQILVGISFFSTFSHRYNDNGKQSETQVAKENHSASPVKQQISSIFDSGLDFPCNITGKEAVSAINRATTKGCKKEIADLVCAMEKGTVYPSILPRYCPNKVDKNIVGKHIGCFQDSFTKRLLQGHVVKLKTKNSPTFCTEICSKSGFSYAGVQYGMECFCGNSRPEPSSALENSKCSMKCPGSQDATCGGYLAVDVYETGLKPLVPSKLGSEISLSPQPPVKLVYLLTVSGRASRQVYRLIRQIYSPDHYVLVHVDRRQEFMYREIEALAKKLPNLRMVKQRFSTIWGGASLLSMLMSSIQELVDMDDWTDWDFVLNLSESDYPVKTQAELVTFLSNNRGNNFVKGHGREQEKFIKKQGLDKTFYECDTHMWRLGPRTLPLGVQIDGGSDWICLNKKFATYVIQSKDELVVGLKKVFSHTLLPAESFFHTVLRNSEFCMTYIDNNLHLTNWKRKLGCKCQYKAIVDWCGCSPNDFLPEDWTKLEATRARQLFFARKFEPIIHQGILNKVEEWTKNITIEESPAKHSYWQNVFHADDSKHAVDVSSLSSLVEKNVKQIAQISGQDLAFRNIQQVTTYSYRNEYQSSLVLINAKNVGDEKTLNFELKIKYGPKLTMNEGIETRLEHMSVGTGFDPKELLFRNFLNLIDQNSKLSVKVTFSEGKTEVIKFGWFDPNLTLVSTNKIQFNDTSGIDSVLPILKSPLQAGIWTVVAVSEGHLVAREEFLVNPCVDVEMNVSVTEARTDMELEKFVLKKLDHKTDNIEEAAAFLELFFQVSEICADDAQFVTGEISRCSETIWSSRYPDTKSQILGSDSKTGTLL